MHLTSFTHAFFACLSDSQHLKHNILPSQEFSSFFNGFSFECSTCIESVFSPMNGTLFVRTKLGDGSTSVFLAEITGRGGLLLCEVLEN